MSVSGKELLAVGVPYIVGVGAAYTLGYWGAFGLNPLQFMGLNELARLAVYPLLATLALGVVAMAANHLLLSDVLPPGGGAESSLGRAGRKYWRPTLALLGAAIVVTVLYAPEPNKWLLFALLVSTLSTPLAHLPRFIELLPNPHVRSFVLLLVVALPALSFAQARLRAHAVVHQGAELRVDLARSALPVPGVPSSAPDYLGHLGGMHVLREPSSGVLMLVKQNESAPLRQAN
jgi:hypothetical protein